MLSSQWQLLPKVLPFTVRSGLQTQTQAKFFRLRLEMLRILLHGQNCRANIHRQLLSHRCNAVGELHAPKFSQSVPILPKDASQDHWVGQSQFSQLKLYSSGRNIHCVFHHGSMPHTSIPERIDPAGGSATTPFPSMVPGPTTQRGPIPCHHGLAGPEHVLHLVDVLALEPGHQSSSVVEGLHHPPSPTVVVAHLEKPHLFPSHQTGAPADHQEQERQVQVGVAAP